MDRSAKRAARHQLPGRAGAAVRPGLGAARHGAVCDAGRRRGRSRRRDGGEGEELVGAPVQQMRLFLLALALIAGCATPPAEEPVSRPEPQPEAAPQPDAAPPPVAAPEPPPPPARTENIAVAGLMETARVDAAAGRLSTA